MRYWQLRSDGLATWGTGRHCFLDQISVNLDQFGKKPWRYLPDLGRIWLLQLHFGCIWATAYICGRNDDDIYPNWTQNFDKDKHCQPPHTIRPTGKSTGVKRKLWGSTATYNSQGSTVFEYSNFSEISLTLNSHSLLYFDHILINSKVSYKKLRWWPWNRNMLQIILMNESPIHNNLTPNLLELNHTN